MKFLVWLSGPGEARTSPWVEVPLHVTADDPGEAIAKAVQWAREQGRLIDRATATRLPEDTTEGVARPAVGLGSPPPDLVEPPFRPAAPA